MKGFLPPTINRQLIDFNGESREGSSAHKTPHADRDLDGGKEGGFRAGPARVRGINFVMVERPQAMDSKFGYS
jgi:hypothetical protein